MNEKLRQRPRTIARAMCRFLLAGALAISILGMPSTTARADTPVCGPIAADATWNIAGSPYIVTCNVVVSSGVTLTIQPGVVVKFDPGTSLQVDGELVAEECTFTSNAAIPAKGDWGRVHFTSTSVDAQLDAQGDYVSGSKIEDCLIEWGGDWVPDGGEGAIHVEVASPLIILNTIRNNTRGIMAVGRTSINPIVIRQNQIIDNEPSIYNYGAGMNVSLSIVISNTVAANHTTWVGGILATSSIITGNTISGNGDIGGEGTGGLQAEDSKVINNLISNNTSPYGCAGIRAKGDSEVTDNIIRDNSGGTGGACADGGIVARNTVFGNTTGGSGGGFYATNATLEENIVYDNTASSGGGIAAGWSILTNNSIYDNSATAEGGGISLWGDFTGNNNSITGNSATDGGGAHLAGWYGGAGDFAGNLIENNTANKGGGIFALATTVRGNTITGNSVTSDGGGIYAESSSLEDNTITGNTVPSYGHGSGAYLKSVTEFSNNTVISNTAGGGTAGGISVEGVSEFHYNNLYANQPYDAEVVSAEPVTGTLNYWGETLCTDIPTKIYDGNDLPGRGELAYAPSLYAPLPLAQLESPAGLGLTTVTTGTVELAWTAIADIPLVGCRVPGSTEPDSGYRVYYDTDEGCAPFEGTGLAQGDSPIDVGQATEAILSGLGGNTYFIVTAYDYLGRESSFSNVVHSGTGAEGHQLFLPSISNSTGQ